LKIGGLYSGQDKNGNDMFSGNVDIPVDVVINPESRIVIFTNPRKEAENHPDFEVFLTKNEPRNG
jgi:uncharacterized protein (DUF736 family)